jgi:uncharacterized tellurite resistance protein B-like protein
LDADKLLLLDVLQVSKKIETVEEQEFSSLVEPLDAIDSANLHAYVHSLEQVRAGSSINLTTIAVILNRLEFLKNIIPKT